LLPKLDRFVFPVGRLDKETSGLLIFTDDHRLGEALTNPESHVPKTYKVLVDAEPDLQAMAALRTGLNIGRGEVTRASTVEVVRVDSDGVSLEMVIDEGKNRQIRRMVAAVGLKVLSLARVGIGSFELGALPIGQYRRLGPREQRLLSSPPSSGYIS
ncbi:MAG: pseudouridine synthase, partial [Vicinamibacteria bacterium]